MAIEIKKIDVKGALVHVSGLVDGKNVDAKGAAYPYQTGKSPVHKRRYLEQLLTAALVNDSHRDDPHAPGDALPGSFIIVAEWLKTRIEHHEGRIQDIEADFRRINEADRLRDLLRYRTFWQRIVWLWNGR
jgi:hypothetical protein